MPNPPSTPSDATFSANPSPESPALSMTRTYDAPRELVFRAFAEAERLARWWGPAGFEVQVKRLDCRPGGVFHYRMVHSEGHEMWGQFLYREIVEPERIVWVNTFSDPDGNLVRAPFSQTVPLEILNTITLEAQGQRTVLRLQVTPINATAEERAAFVDLLESMQQGYGGTFDQLADELARDQAA
ncbi:MAG: SRPBCC domain-containing protein [Chloroflexi bacterium]|nr:SRPBCC domain-containing protein [Chloroflexota bacterium]